MHLPAPETAAGREIVQVIREIGPAAGAERVAFELAKALDRKGMRTRVLASEAAGLDGLGTTVEPVAPWLRHIPTRGPLRHLGRLVAVPLFTLAATLAARRRRGAVVISHGDCLEADILVIHAVNAESLRLKRLAGEWRWLLNPLHLWVWPRTLRRPRSRPAGRLGPGMARGTGGGIDRVPRGRRRGAAKPPS